MGQNCCAQEGSGHHVEGGDGSSELATQVARRDAGGTNAGTVFAITLHKANNERLGLDIDFVPEREVMPVRAVTGFLAEKWNREHPDSRVLPGDRIVAVNGTSGTADLMMKQLKGSDVAKITLVRLKKDGSTPLSLPRGATVYTGKMSHDYLGDDIPVRLEVRCVDGHWSGEWVVMDQRERVQIEVSGGSHIRIVNTSGEERTELLGTATQKGILSGELFQSGCGGGSFELKPMDDLLASKASGLDDMDFVRAYQDWPHAGGYEPVQLYDIAPGQGDPGDFMMSSNIGEPVRGVTPSFGDPVKGMTPSFGEPVRGATPSFGEPITGLTPSFGEPVSGLTPSFGEPNAGLPKPRISGTAEKIDEEGTRADDDKLEHKA